RNNHLYWAALAAAATGIAADDRALFDWAVARYRFALTQIDADGALPQELARASRARHYHLFALAPLVMVAELGASNGLDLYAEHDGALHRLVARVVGSPDDPAWFERRTGHPQERGEALTGWSLAWAEPYYARFHNARLVPYLARLRPARNI